MKDTIVPTASFSPMPLLCALLRGETPAWPATSDDVSIAVFLRTARCHGVTPLLDAKFVESGLQESWPQAIRQTCHEDAVAQAMHELATRAETGRILAMLGRAEIRPLLLKGTGLAYSHYPSPVLRPRADVDVLVAPSEREAAWRILQDLGYRRIGGPAGTFGGYQLELHYDDPRGVTHNVDLHWRISNAQSFAWLFTFEDLAAASPHPLTAPCP